MKTDNHEVEKLQLWASKNVRPNLADLIASEWPALDAVAFLVSLLHQAPVKASVDIGSGILQLTDNNSLPLITARKNSAGDIIVDGPDADALQTLLMAIRIHEVESYDWAWLPPANRDHELTKFLQGTHISRDQIKRATALWTACK